MGPDKTEKGTLHHFYILLHHVLMENFPNTKKLTFQWDAKTKWEPSLIGIKKVSPYPLHTASLHQRCAVEEGGTPFY